MSSDETLIEGFELNKSLRHLRSLLTGRQECLAELQKHIERALLLGKLTGLRKHNTGRNCLSKRAVATLELQASQLKRNIFYLMERERQILARLSAIGDITEQKTASEDLGSSGEEAFQVTEDTQEQDAKVDEVEETA